MDSPSYLYIKSEANLWTVGFYAPNGQWEPESDYGSQDDAAARVHYLNGGDEAQAELLKAIENVLPYLPDRNDAKNYAATNEGRASNFQVAAIHLREIYARTK